MRRAYPVMAGARFETLGPTGGTAVGRCTALSRSPVTGHRSPYTETARLIGNAQRQRPTRNGGNGASRQRQRARGRPAGGALFAFSLWSVRVIVRYTRAQRRTRRTETCVTHNELRGKPLAARVRSSEP